MNQLLFRWCAFFLMLAPGLFSVSYGAIPSEDLFPATTKGYVSVPNLQELKTAWGETQFGQMIRDPAMKPFVDDLERQLRSRLNQAGVRLGITWEDLVGVASGEVAVGTVQPKGDKTKAATILVADVTGNTQKANQLLQKISKDLVGRGAQRGTQKIPGAEFATFTFPKKKPTDRQVTVLYTIHQDQLLVTDDKEVAQNVVGRFKGEHADSLRHLPAFETTQKRSAEGMTKAHLSWFVEPFGYVETVRAYAGGRKKRGSDLLKTLANQGFNCVKGIGGKVALETGEHEIQHRSFVFAPSVKREANDANQSKYNLAARMLDFPNSKDLEIQNWIPKRLATYMTFRWKLKDAFWYSESLVNEIADAEVFREVLNDIEKDPNGPQINVEKEFVQFLDERVTMISDYREPIDTKSERVLLAVQVKDPQSVMATLNKTMRSDRNAKEIKIDGHIIWEITQDEEFAVEEIKIDGVDFGANTEVAQVNEQAQGQREFRPNAAVTVAHGHFLIGTHVDYVAELLKELDQKDRLSDAPDYKRVMKALEGLGAGEDSFHYFARTDEAYRVTYEMLRQNKMPEAETLLAKLLNGVLSSDDDNLREQQIDGRKLPEFAQIQKYFGPSGLFIRSTDDGWTITGCLLHKAAAE